MTTLLHPVQDEVARPEHFGVTGLILDRGNPTAVPSITTTEITDPNFIYRFKDADQSISTETLTTVTGLTLPVALRDMWRFEYDLEFSRIGTTSLEIGLDLPTGVFASFVVFGAYDSFTTYPADSHTCYSTRLSGTGSQLTATVNQYATRTSLSNLGLKMIGVAIGDSGAGDIEVIFSKADSNSSSVEIDGHSTNSRSVLVARRMLF